MENKKYLNELHKEHGEWTSALQFAKDELVTFQHRLGEVVHANTKTEILAQVEHFQNQFIRQNEVIDILLHEINLEEDKLVASAQSNNVATEHRTMPENEKLVEEMKSFDKIYLELKEEFKSFLSMVL